MAISFVRGSGVGGGYGTTNIDNNVDCTGGDCLVFFGSDLGGSGNMSATYNGVAMTEIAENDKSGGLGAKVAAYILVLPASGTNVLRLTNTTPFAGYNGLSWSVWSGVNTTGTVGNTWRSPFSVGYSDASSSVISIGVTNAVNGDIVVDGVANYGINISQNETSVYLGNNIGGGAYDFEHQYAVATGSKTMTCGGGEFWSGIGFALIPAAGASFVAPSQRAILQAVNRSNTY